MSKIKVDVMGNDWLEIMDDDIDVEAIMGEIRKKVETYDSASVKKPVTIADTLWEEIIGDPKNPLIANRVPIRPQDCDISPRNYKIEWRIPIVGHIHAFVRRIIDNEIRLFLFPTLDKQIRYNRRALWVMRALVEENLQLHEHIAKLEKKIKEIQ